MTNAGLKYINDILEALDINYEFGEWTNNTISDPYWVGEYNEVDGIEKEENGFQETTFIITGTGRSWLKLQNDKSTIEKNISQTAILSDGTGIAVFYSASLTIPTGDAELKRLQINLQIKEWSVI